jgi:hypothetical protein
MACRLHAGLPKAHDLFKPDFFKPDFFKPGGADRRKDVNARRRHTQLIDQVWHGKLVRPHAGERSAELSQRLENTVAFSAVGATQMSKSLVNRGSV